MNINLHIERVVLDGLSLQQRDGPHFQAAVEQELMRLLSAAGTRTELRAGFHAERVDAGRIRVAAGAEPSSVGREIAAAVYRGVAQRSGARR
jgi:hypothetical protein